MKAYIKILSSVLVAVIFLTCLSIFGVSAEEVQPAEFIYGDVDMDGDVTIKDATLIQKGVAGLVYLTGVQRYLTDPQSSDVTVKEATTIQKKLAGISVANSLVGTTVDMASQDEFSSEFSMDDLFEENLIMVMPKLDLGYVYEYTLEDFPEYEFDSIRAVGSEERGYIIYFLYLKTPNKNSVREAIEALDYRANLDLRSVHVNYLFVSA